MDHSYALFQDWKANKGNIKGRLIMLSFRIAHIATKNKLLHIIWIPYLVWYKITVLWFLGVELQHRVKAGRGLQLWHGQALVVHRSTRIGSNCTLRHSTTIGNTRGADGEKKAGAVIGNNVNIGAHVCIIGSINIGDNVTIGAGSIVTKSFPANCIIAGNPATILRSYNKSHDASGALPV